MNTPAAALLNDHPILTRPDWTQWALGPLNALAARADCSRRQVGAVILDDAPRPVRGLLLCGARWAVVPGRDATSAGSTGHAGSVRKTSADLCSRRREATWIRWQASRRCPRSPMNR